MTRNEYKSTVSQLRHFIRYCDDAYADEGVTLPLSGKRRASVRVYRDEIGAQLFELITPIYQDRIATLLLNLTAERRKSAMNGFGSIPKARQALDCSRAARLSASPRLPA